jgi:nitroimidazol reductase NimA-like FMN-containing flavoprotein (pyridoxamine 5'-phosphate oxidase superfamily)
MQASSTFGSLTNQEIDALLRRQRVGRIGVIAAGRVLIEPAVYDYDGVSVYASTHADETARYLRGQPRVSFEVEEVESPTSLWVVILKGICFVLDEPREREAALERIIARAGVEQFGTTPQELEREGTAVYRIEIVDRSGRYEGFPPWAHDGKGEGQPYVRYVPIYAEPPWDWR